MKGRKEPGSTTVAPKSSTTVISTNKPHISTMKTTTKYQTITTTTRYYSKQAYVPPCEELNEAVFLGYFNEVFFIYKFDLYYV